MTAPEDTADLMRERAAQYDVIADRMTSWVTDDKQVKATLAQIVVELREAASMWRSRAKL